MSEQKKPLFTISVFEIPGTDGNPIYSGQLSQILSTGELVAVPPLNFNAEGKCTMFLAQTPADAAWAMIKMLSITAHVVDKTFEGETRSSILHLLKAFGLPTYENVLTPPCWSIAVRQDAKGYYALLEPNLKDDGKKLCRVAAPIYQSDMEDTAELPADGLGSPVKHFGTPGEAVFHLCSNFGSMIRLLNQMVHDPKTTGPADGPARTIDTLREFFGELVFNEFLAQPRPKIKEDLN